MKTNDKATIKEYDSNGLHEINVCESSVIRCPESTKRTGEGYIEQNKTYISWQASAGRPNRKAKQHS